jgi:hypothetical protein
MEVFNLNFLVDMASPSIKYLEYTQLLNVGLDLVLLNLLEIGLSPMPQVFGLLYFSHLNFLLLQHYIL